MKQWLILWDFVILTIVLLTAGMNLDQGRPMEVFFTLLAVSAIQALVMTIRVIK